MTHAIEAYVPPGLIGATFIRCGLEWWIVPSVAGGWRSRRKWTPSPAAAHAVLQYGFRNFTMPTGSWMLHSWLGVPRDLGKVAAMT